MKDFIRCQGNVNTIYECANKATEFFSDCDDSEYQFCSTCYKKLFPKGKIMKSVFNKTQILLVEDHYELRRALRDLIRSAYPEIKLFTASNGKDAVEIIRETQGILANIDLIITDYQMPSMNGEELAQLLRSEGFSKPIILFTSDPSLCQDQTLFDKILSKQEPMSELVEAIHEFTSASRSEA